MKFQKHLGLDIGSSSMKLVQLSLLSSGKFKLEAIAASEVPSVIDNQPANQDVVAQNLRNLIKESKANTNQAVISLPESQVYTRLIEMPFLGEPELSAAIKWQAEQFLPVPISEVVYRHQVVSEPETGTPDAKMQVLLVAAPITTVNNYVAILSKAGLETISVETETFAITRSLLSPDQVTPTTLLLNFGSEGATIAVISNSEISLVQTISTGGKALSRAISSELGVDASQAEEYKKAYGLDQTKLDGKVFNAIKPLVDIIIEEVRRVVQFRLARVSEDPVKRLLVAGGGSLVPGFVPYLTNALTIETQLGDPFVTVEMAEDQRTKIGENKVLFAASVGLAQKLT